VLKTKIGNLLGLNRLLVTLVISSLIFLFSFQRGVAQKSTDSLSYLENVKKQYSILISDNQMKFAQSGFWLYDLKNKKLLIQNQADKAFAPASTLKLLSTITAMEVLGEDFQFFTLFGYSGKLNEGILDGDIVIKGSGDPSLASSFLEKPATIKDIAKQVAKSIKAKGINTIYGKVIIDNSLYSSFLLPDGYTVGDIGNNYGTSIYGLNLADNMLTVTFEPGKIGDFAKIKKIEPEGAKINLTTQVKYAQKGSGDNTNCYAFPLEENVLLKGTIPEGDKSFKVRIACPNPMLLFGYHIQQALIREGIEIGNDYEVSQFTIGFQTIDSLKSVSLIELANTCNLYSLNHYAEGLVLAAANKASGAKDLTEAINWELIYWKEKKLDLSGSRLFDGSGLSPNNGITVEVMGGLLQFLSQSVYGNKVINGLPTLGSSGTLTDAAEKSKLNNRIKAKTGSIGGVYNFAGFVLDAECKEPQYAFVLFNNRFVGSGATFKKKCGKLLSELATLP